MGSGRETGGTPRLQAPVRCQLQLRPPLSWTPAARDHTYLPVADVQIETSIPKLISRRNAQLRLQHRTGCTFFNIQELGLPRDGYFLQREPPTPQKDAKDRGQGELVLLFF